jgi:flagellar protein FlaG
MAIDSLAQAVKQSGSQSGKAKPVPVADAAKAAAAAVEAQAKEPPATIERVKAAAQQIESYLRSVDQGLQFRVDGGSGQVVVTVVDNASGKVIRQIPGEEALRLARRFSETASALVDHKV